MVNANITEILWEVQLLNDFMICDKLATAHERMCCAHTEHIHLPKSAFLYQWLYFEMCWIGKSGIQGILGMQGNFLDLLMNLEF